MKTRRWRLVKVERYTFTIVLGFCLLLGIWSLVSVVFLDPAPRVVHNLAQGYYYTYETDEGAHDPSSRRIRLYKPISWWLDQPIADVPIGRQWNSGQVRVSYASQRLQVALKGELIVDTLLNEQHCLHLSEEALLAFRIQRAQHLQKLVNQESSE